MSYPFFVRRIENVLVPASKAGQLAIEKLLWLPPVVQEVFDPV